jgi:hypothetical protein
MSGGTLQTSIIQGLPNGQDDLIFGTPEDSIFIHTVTTYSRFAWDMRLMTPKSGQDTMKVPGTDLNIWSLQDHDGDLTGDVNLEMILPALLPNTASTGQVAHYQNCAPYAAIDVCTLKVGSSESAFVHGRYMEFISEMIFPPGRRLMQTIGKFDNSADLIAAAETDQRLFVPLLLPQTRFHHNWINNLAANRTSVQITIKWKPLADWTVNGGGAEGEIPFKYAAANPVALTNNDIYVKLWATTVFLDHHEHHLMKHGKFTHINFLTQESTAACTSTQAEIKLLDIGHNHLLLDVFERCCF